MKGHTDNQANITAIECQPKTYLAIEPEQSDSLSLVIMYIWYIKKCFSTDYDFAHGLQPIDNSTHFKLGWNEFRIDGNKTSNKRFNMQKDGRVIEVTFS